MKVLYFDCFSGISGDMTLGALIDLGIDKDVFINELNKLNLDGYKISINEKMVSGIKGTDVNVVISDEHEDMHSHVNVDSEHDNNHYHEHHHEHHCDHKHEHEHKSHHHHNHAHPMRNLSDIEEIINRSSLKPKIKDFSKMVFREIAKAEAKVHNKSINEIHFHEVGAVDSIVDIVGTAICIELLGVDRIYSSPLHDGHGFIKCQHGCIPVPVPAVMEMLSGSGIPVISEDVGTELVTPTGMGLIKCLSSGFGNMPAIYIEKAGYGMGKRETGRFNALRVVMGTLVDSKKSMDEIVVLETNIDDMSPEILGFTSEKLMRNGALDVFFTPVYMKKNRPGVLLTVLANEKDEEKLVDIILEETSTLGIRRSTSIRYCMSRETVNVTTEYGDVRVKIASRGNIKKFAPEYEDCRNIAEKTGMSLKSVYDMVCEKYRR